MVKGIGNRIKEARLALGITQEQLANMIGITKGAIANYENNASHPKDQILFSLIDALHVDANFLFQDCVSNQNIKTVSAEAMNMARTYDKLDEWGQKVVSDVINDEFQRVSTKSVDEIAYRTIPLFGQRFAAGSAEPDFAMPVETYRVPADISADFAIHIHGTSMEPYLKDGSIAIGLRRWPKNGEAGAFLLDGEFLVKQYFADDSGNVYLLSANRNEEDKDVVLFSFDRENHELKPFGVILTDKPLPRVRI